MSRQAVKLRVPIDEAWDAGERLEVFTDFGSGTIDTDTPLLSRGMDLFPGQHAAKGFGRQRFGRSRFGDLRASRPVRGFGRTRWGVTPWGRTPPVIDVLVNVPAGYGEWKFGARVVDRDGTPQGGGLQEFQAMVSGTEPPGLAAFSFVNHDTETDQVTFAFTKDVD